MLGQFKEKDTPLSPDILTEDIFERRLTNLRNRNQHLTTKDLVDQIENGQNRFFLIEAGAGGTGKTSMMRRLDALLKERGIDSVYILQSQKATLEQRHQELENTQHKVVIVWDEYQNSQVGALTPFFKSPLSHAMLKNPNIYLVVCISPQIAGQVVSGCGNRKAMRSLFYQNQWRLDKSTPQELMLVFDFMLNSSGFKVSSDGERGPNKEQGKVAGEGQALSGKQRSQLQKAAIYPGSKFVKNPNFTQVIQYIYSWLNDPASNTAGVGQKPGEVEMLPFSLILDSFDFDTRKAWYDARKNEAA